LPSTSELGISISILWNPSYLETWNVDLLGSTIPNFPFIIRSFPKEVEQAKACWPNGPKEKTIKMSRTTKFDSKGNPRTKGIRNPFVEYAKMGTKGGAMRDARNKRGRLSNLWKKDLEEK
jgi:hypothetical protein